MQVHFISHTHWDREWYLTYEQFRLRLVGLIDRLLDLLESTPEFRFFHLDGQTIVLEDYLEIRPREEPRLRRLIADGRILIGPWYDMPDEFLVSGESLVRNLALGHRIARRYGTPMPVGYLPDLFGHVSQMPQILRNFGLDNAVLWRGFGGPRAEYWWQAPAGSRVLMLHLPRDGYCNATRVHLNRHEMLDRATRAIENERARTAVGEVLLMSGVDHVEPHPIVPELIGQLSSRLNAPVRHSTLPAYVDAVRSAVNDSGPELELVEGELRSGEDYANLLPGVFSARVYIKQANARVQTLLERRAEPLAAFASMLGARYPADELAYAWKTLLQNHPHDSICGCSIDPVHRENMTRFARAEQVVRALIDQAASVLARGVPAAPAGMLRLVAINTTVTAYSGVIEAVVDLPYEDAEPRRPDPEALDAPVVLWPKAACVVAVATHNGAALPFQILSDEDVVTFVLSRYDTPWPLRARRYRVLFAADVPACGYTCFDVEIDSAFAGEASAEPVGPAITSDERSAENEHVRITVNDDGTLDVLDKRSGTLYPRCGELEDVGDVGDEYNYSPPASDRVITSRDARDVHITRLASGPLRAEFHIELALPLPVSCSGDRASRAGETVLNPVTVRVALDAHSPRVDWNVALENRSKDHRLRMLFPVAAASVTHVRAETAFGVAVRPARRERPKDVRVEVPVSYAPTASFTEAGDDDVGAIVFGEGLSEYEAYTESGPPRLALTLLRSVGFLSRADLVMRPSGHAGPELATPEAQCVGRHEVRLAFEPRAQRPSNAALYERAASFVAPPHVVPAIGNGGQEPAASRFFEIDAKAGGAILSACHRTHDRDGLLLRFFNPDPTPAQIAVTPRFGIARAQFVDFLERETGDTPVSNGTLRVNLDPYRIVTLVVTPGLTAFARADSHRELRRVSPKL